MLKKIVKSSVYLAALLVATLVSVFVGSKGVSDYVLSHGGSTGDAPVALAETPGGGGGDGGAGAAAGADCGSASSGAASCSADGGGGGGGGGGCVICTELHRQGTMAERIWRSDQAFGRQLWMSDPDVMVGYHAWAPTVVHLMKSSTTVSSLVALFVLPWAKEMAYRMGVETSGSLFGRGLMRVGVPTCRVIGTSLRMTSIAVKNFA